MPGLIAHADWSRHANKRWMSVAARAGATYVLAEPEAVGDLPSLLHRLQGRASDGPVVAGFDFPIGIPTAHARRAGIERFLDVLPLLGTGAWRDFYDVAATPDEIGPRRPFYPRKALGSRQAHLVAGLGVDGMRDLLRQCDRGSQAQGDACAVFWTVGGKQVGPGTIVGWRDLLAPALRARERIAPPAEPARPGFPASDARAPELGAAPLDVAVWPFEGDLDRLLADHACVVVETYPAAACVHLGLGAPGRGWRKGSRPDRAAHAPLLLTWAARRGVALADELAAAVRDGFGAGAGGEDRFDAVVGLMAMLDVILGHRGDGAPDSPSVREVEGWIFGRAASSAASQPGPRYGKLSGQSPHAR